MKNSEILNSVAMMSVLYDSFKGDYYDLLIQFVKNILPANIGEEIRKEDLAISMYEEYGFRPPLAILDKVLKRLAKENPKLVRIEYNKFYVNKELDNEAFNSRRYHIKEKNEKITCAYISYVYNTFGEKITEENANNQLKVFFGRFGNDIYNEENLDYSISMTDNKSNRVFYGIGRFISNEKSKSSTLYADILDVVKGYLIFNAIYFFFKNTKKDINSKLNNVKFILDSSLVLDILDYHENGNVSKELVKLIRDYSGEVGIYSHTLREMKNILYAYMMNSYEVREQMQIVKYKRLGYSNEQILRDIDLLDNRILASGIKIISPRTINYIDGDEISDLGIINEDALKEMYLDQFKLNAPKELGVEHDIKCISYTSRLRKGCSFESLESCLAIFVTKNYRLVNASELLLEGNRSLEDNNIINYAMKETDLTSILWLNKYNELKDIPEIILMERVYAAINASDEVLKKYFEELKILEDDHDLTEGAAFILRTSEKFREQVVVESKNAPEEITKQLIIKVYESFESEIAEKYIDKAKKEFDDNVKEKDKKTQKSIADKATEYSLDMMNKRKKYIKIGIGLITVMISFFIILFAIMSYSNSVSRNISIILIAIVFNLPNIDFIFSKGKVVEKLLLKSLEKYRVNTFHKKINEYKLFMESMEE